MFLRLLFTCNMFALFGVLLQAQTSSFQPVVFTWEGASYGNKAIWRADDTLNVYRNIEGIDVSVRLIDTLGLNTTTKNPSEFNDFTKTNTFFGKGNLALQITSNQTKQPVCLEFTFSKPVFLLKYRIFDIDMLQSASNLWSTYQDSLSFRASNLAGNVPLILEKMDSIPTYTIYGQSVKANFIPGVNGDVTNSDLRGGLLISSNQPLQKIVMCYSNGSDDDGLSNSHAVKIPQFEFSELLGRIEGTVYEVTTRTPLAGSVVRLVDEKGELVVNKEGLLMQTMTDETGHYSFSFLPMGTYTILQTNSPGYDNAGDIDGINDNTITSSLHVDQVISSGNDFYDILSAPLLTETTEFFAYKVSGQRYGVEWLSGEEVSSDVYTVLASGDGINYEEAGKLVAKGTGGSRYWFSFEYTKDHHKLYVRLISTTADGRVKELGTRVIRNEGQQPGVSVFPNPATDLVHIDLGQASEDSSFEYLLTDSTHRLITSGKSTIGDRIITTTLDGCPDGFYFLTIIGENGRFVKQLVIRH